MYTHPSIDIDEFSAYFQTILPKLTSKQIFKLGAFSINLLNYESHSPTNVFINNFLSKNFQLCIHHPTRIFENSSTMIDNIFTNIIANILFDNILRQISDHLSQLIILKNTNISHFSSTSFVYDYSSFVETNFINDFFSIDFSYLNKSPNLSFAMIHF